jgi:hypothetical protein
VITWSEIRAWLFGRRQSPPIDLPSSSSQELQAFAEAVREKLASIDASIRELGDEQDEARTQAAITAGQIITLRDRLNMLEQGRDEHQHYQHHQHYRDDDDDMPILGYHTGGF